jgi:hypothetical protein
LLNFLLDDCKDAQDLGTGFHYSWLLILIDVMGWKESKYSFFSTKPKPCHGVRYLSLGATSDAKNRKEDASIFKGYLPDMQDTITSTWRVTLEDVA